MQRIMIFIRNLKVVKKLISKIKFSPIKSTWTLFVWNRLKSALASSSKHHNTNINNESTTVVKGVGGEGSECTERDLLIPLG